MAPDAPPVLRWFKLYAGFLAALYGVLTIIGLVVIAAAGQDEEISVAGQLMIGAVFLLLCGGLTALFAFGVFAPRASWVWIYDIVLIAIGLTSCLTIPAALPLLIFWIKPETKAYFGRV